MASCRDGKPVHVQLMRWKHYSFGTKSLCLRVPVRSHSVHVYVHPTGLRPILSLQP